MAIHAQMRNQTLGVTGILLVIGDQFVQILEGDRGAVRWIYKVIAADPRHQDVLKLVDGPIDLRAFNGWYMRLLTADDLSDREREFVVETLQSDAGEAGARPATDLLASGPALALALTTGVRRPRANSVSRPLPSAA
jgi:hypothetical protein